MMKLGITYLYTISAYGYPPKIEDDYRALADIEAMGFHYLEMEALGTQHAQAVWENRLEFKARLETHGIHVHNFCAVDPELVSLDESLRAAALERFKRTSELGAFLGAETIHLASYAPPIEYISSRPYALGEAYAIPGRMMVRIPDGFDWNRVWSALVESCRRCAEVARAMGRVVIMEPRIGETICSADSLIRLIDDVGMDNFKANFDTGHLSAQRENIPLALMKLAGRFANIHIADNDLTTADHLAVGDGVIDWLEFFRVLKGMNYAGYLGLDLGDSPQLKENLTRSVQHVRDVTRQLGINIDV